ncbi:MAG: caspase family protein, partial [Anaerolineales bacterium]|nr:caspase family protein [Anaerolineales bacterium]
MAHKRALVIGNSQYQDPALAQLKAPDADVRALTDLLRQPDIGQFDEVTPLVNEPEAATRRAIASFFARARPDDMLLLYFSGHGVLDDRGRLYLAAHDTQRDLPQATAISAAFVTDAMDGSRSRRQVLILDCCHSGAFARGARGAGGAKAVTAATFEGVGYGRAVITATDATQFAWEGETVIGAAENSVFTHYMIEGLKTGAADVDDDGEITLEELYNYLYGEVVKRTPKQTPRKWSYNQEGEFVIARNPRPLVVKPLPLPDDLQHSLEDLRPWVRVGALGELERLLFGDAPGLALSALAALVKLKDDDSRRVSVAAAELVAKYEALRQAREQERLAAEQAEAERLAIERAAAERLAAEQAEAERLAIERAAAERLAA